MGSSSVLLLRRQIGKDARRWQYQVMPDGMGKLIQLQDQWTGARNKPKHSDIALLVVKNHLKTYEILASL
jgi:hypothetical protein